MPVTLEIMKLSAAQNFPGEKGSGLGVTWGFVLSLLAAAILSVLLGYGLHAGTERAIPWKEAWNLLFGLKGDGVSIYLGTDFWLMHLPFLPLSVFVGFFLFGSICKAVISVIQRFGGQDSLTNKPFLASGLSCAVMALLFVGGGALIGL